VFFDLAIFRMPMKPTFRNLLALCVACGVMAGASQPATAATTKKKVVASKKVENKSIAKKAQKPGKSTARRATADNDDGSGTIDNIKSAAVAVIDQNTGNVLFEKNSSAVVPIASITKLMTAMVALDVEPSLNETLTIGEADVDTIKGTHSRLGVGTQLSREEMLRLALMSSENRAASTLSRHYPGGRDAFVAAMNAKAKMLGLTETRFADPTGLTPENVSSARDLVKLVNAAHQYPLIREFSTSEEYQVAIRGRPQMFRNTNALVRNDGWNIGLSKTGYISEAGKCLVMQVWLDNKPTIIVLLDSWGKLTRIGDANRIKRWIESLASSRTLVRS
jgi:serine-type D-Ala-D-Ala endopeptidase (penicillin-binding protein 7)